MNQGGDLIVTYVPGEVAWGEECLNLAAETENPPDFGPEKTSNRERFRTEPWSPRRSLETQ